MIRAAVTGVVLMTYGAPADDADLARYLAAVRGGKPADPALVSEMARRYAAIGGSPLIRITGEQAAALERELGNGWLAEAGMRFSEPSIAAAVRRLAARGATRCTGIVLSPQWSTGLMGGYRRQLEEAATAAGVPDVAIAGSWHREPSFIADLAAALREARAGLPPGTLTLLTAHSLPKRIFDAEPEYLAALRETGELVAAAAGVPAADWAWAYQSAGHTQEEWLRPDLKDVFPRVAAEGRSGVLIAPVQFLSDHLEVLYDLDVAAAAEAGACGLRYHRVRMPNVRPSFVRALADIARATAYTSAAGLR